MADIRSAAGEGSEPRVPAQAEPAHELAKLIAESDAKGKGFWRRLRKPKAGTTPAAPPEPKAGTAPAAEPTEPVEAPKPNTTDEPKPAMKAAPATPEDAPTSQPEATPDSEAKSDPEAGTEPEAKAASEAEAKAEPGSEPDSANPAEVVAEGNDSGTSEASEAEESADGASEEAAAGDDSAGDAPTEKAASDASTDDASAKKAESADSADESPAEKAESAESADDSAAEAPAVDDPGAEEQTVEPGNEARSTVGVVYEPDESPDGFPLEYGDIIIGLPKPPETKKNQPKPTTNESAPQPQTDATLTEDSQPQPEKAEAAPEHAEAETEEASADVAEKAEAEPGHAESAADEAEARQEGADVASEGVDVESANAEREAEGEGAGPEGEAVVESADDAKAESGDDEAGDGALEDQVPPAEADSSAADSEQSNEAMEESAAGDEQPSGEGSDEAAIPGDQTSDNAGEHASEASDAGDQSSESADEHASDDHPSEVGESASADESSSDDAGDEQSAEEAGGESTGDRESAGDGEAVGDGGSGGESEAAAEGELAGEAAAEGEQAAGGEQAGDDASNADGVQGADGEQGGEGGVVPAAEGEAEAAEEVGAAAAAEKFATEQAAMALITALMRLRGALASSKLPIDVVGADEARQQQKSMLDQLDDYILPRLVQLEAPVLAVVGGSTGAGKSTLVNSLIGQVVSEPGVLRPTTRSPVLIHNPVDAEWFTGDRVLPGMARSSGEKPGGMEDPGQIRLVAADTVPQGLAFLDAPDIDSVVEANRELATQLLAAADLWLFVTTAARYADAVPWEFLQSASDRSTAVAVVLDRAPSDTIDDITGHLAQMLLERGLGDSPLFSIKETVVDGNGMLPPETVVSIKDWLIDLAADADGRTAVVRRTLHGAVTAMTKKTPPFATAVRAQADTVVELRSNAETAYERAVKDVAKATQDGTMLRGEVLARWQEFVGTGELLKGLQTNVGRMRDKMRTAVVGKPPPTRDLNDAVESGLESLLREHAEAAAERAEESWQSLAAGRQLLAAGDRDMGRMSKEFPAAAGRVVRDWQGYVLDLVRKEGAEKRSTARILAYGVNGLGLALMVVIFASTAGLTGTEIGVGAGTAVVGQKLLEAVFGDQAVRTLAAKAREDLDGRVHALMDAEFARYLEVLDQHPVDPDAPRRLTEAARAVEDCT